MCMRRLASPMAFAVLCIVTFTLLVSSKCAEETPPAERILIDPWSIEGSISLDTKEKNETDKIVIEVLRKDEPFQMPVSWQKEIGFITEIKDDGSFILEPRLKRSRAKLVKGTAYKVVAYYRGQFTNVVDFVPDNIPYSLKGITLTFNPAQNYTLQAKLVFAESGKPVPNFAVKIEGYGSIKGQPPRLGYWTYGEAKTDDNGVFKLSGLPLRRYKVVDSSLGLVRRNIGPLGPNNTPQFGVWPESLPEEKIQQLKDEALPTLYYVPTGKGIYWKEDEYSTPDGLKKVPPGIVVVFRGEKDERGWAWPEGQRPAFEVTVGEKNIIKSPVVPNGEYLMSAQNGLFKETVVWINGLGSLGLVELDVLEE